MKITEENYHAYNGDLCMYPVWNGDFVWQESVTFCEAEEGTLPSCRLLYAPTEILSVRDMQQEVVYEEGKDYTVNGDVITLTPGSRITPLLRKTYETYPENVGDGWPTIYGNVFYRPIGYEAVTSHGASVSYKAKGTWRGMLPPDESKHLSRFFDKLQKGEEVTVLWYGDSQFFGADGSGPNGFEPKYPPFAKMVTDEIQKKYPNAKVNYVNTSVGGTATDWALKNYKELVSAYNPDLVLIKFGANEIWRSPEEFKGMTKELIEKIHADCPDAEMALVSMFSCNPECTVFNNENMVAYEAGYRELQKETDVHIAVLSVYQPSRYVVARKGYVSMTGNMINHVTDFGCRVNGQLILRGLGLL